MTDEKKSNPITMEETNDPTADELVVQGLRQEIAQKEQRIIELEYEVGGMSDMARMNSAANIFCAQIQVAGRVPEYPENWIRKAVDAADKLIQHYQDIIEKNATIYQKKLAALENGNGDDETVQ